MCYEIHSSPRRKRWLQSGSLIGCDLAYSDLGLEQTELLQEAARCLLDSPRQALRGRDRSQEERPATRRKFRQLLRDLWQVRVSLGAVVRAVGWPSGY